MPLPRSATRARRLSNPTCIVKYGKKTSLRSRARRLRSSGALRTSSGCTRRYTAGSIRCGTGRLKKLVASSITSPTLLDVRAGGQVEPHAVGLASVAEREHRVGHVVDRHDVDGRVAACGQREVRAARERAQRPVEDVERARPAAVALADDDAGRKIVIGSAL